MCACLCIGEYMHLYIYLYVCVCVCVCIYTYVYALCLCTCVCLCMWVCIMCMYTQVFINIFIKNYLSDTFEIFSRGILRLITSISWPFWGPFFTLIIIKHNLYKIQENQVIFTTYYGASNLVRWIFHIIIIHKTE